METVEQKVKDILVDVLGVDESECVRDADMVKDLDADSLDVVELIMQTEKKFGVSIPDNDALNIHTVGQAIDYISQFPTYRNY